MDIAVAGGTGMLGGHVVAELARRGHDVRVLSRRPPHAPVPGTTHHAVDLVSGDGLRDALAGADAVVEAANTPGTGRKATPVLVEGTRRLLAAEAREGVGNHVAISIVGIDAVSFSYYEAKRAQERLVEQGPVGWSIVRATQFHALLDWIFTTTARAGFVPGNRFALAPVDAQLVARVLADAAEAGPGGRLPPVAGPQAAPLRELGRGWAQARGRRVRPIALPLPRRNRRALMDGALVPGEDAVTGGPSFGDWLRAPEAQELVAA
jgi:uncharacterized protein YbjT (DUF2867 family)